MSSRFAKTCAGSGLIGEVTNTSRPTISSALRLRGGLDQARVRVRRQSERSKRFVRGGAISTGRGEQPVSRSKRVERKPGPPCEVCGPASSREGAHVLRAKIDMASKDVNLRDPLMYRIRKVTHHRTGDDWCIYPMYDYAHPMSDAFEGDHAFRLHAGVRAPQSALPVVRVALRFRSRCLGSTSSRA